MRQLIFYENKRIINGKSRHKSSCLKCSRQYESMIEESSQCISMDPHVLKRALKTKILRFELRVKWSKERKIKKYQPLCGLYSLFNNFYWPGAQSTFPLLWPFIDLLYQPWVRDGDDCGAISGVDGLQWKPKYSEKTCSSSVLSTTNPTWLDPASNMGLQVGKPATNCLNYGATNYLI
jgi:hypothetical protein